MEPEIKHCWEWHIAFMLLTRSFPKIVPGSFSLHLIASVHQAGLLQHELMSSMIHHVAYRNGRSLVKSQLMMLESNDYSVPFPIRSY